MRREQQRINREVETDLIIRDEEIEKKNNCLIILFQEKSIYMNMRIKT